MDNHFFGYNYGYRRSDLARILDAGKVPLALVYTPVVHQFFERVAGTYGLFLEPADVELLKKGLRRRGEKPESIAKRLAGLEAEMAAFQKFRHRFDEVVLVKDDTSVLEACARVATRYRLNPILTLS